MLKAAVSDLRRLRGIAGVLTRHGFDEVARRLWRKASPDSGAAGASAEVAPGGLPPNDTGSMPAHVRVRRVFEELGPTFIKMGQVLSTRPDLLPRAYIEELAHLQDDVASIPVAAVRATIAEALGRPTDELFERFEDEPLATASIAQTHRAWLKDGRCVAVKVQRPGIGETMRSDLDLLRGLAHLIDATIDEARIYDPIGIVREFEAVLIDELNFSLELAHMQAFHANFLESDRLIVPAPYPSLCARTVLTMEFIDGVKLSGLAEEGHDKRGIAEDIVGGWYKMVFIDGLFHADPHPGNLLIVEGDRLALLDYGLVGRVSPAIQDTLALLAVGISMRDVAGLARLIYKVGAPEDRVSMSGFRREIQRLLDRYLDIELHELDTGTLLAELLDVAMRHQIRIQPEYALLAKAGGTIEGVIRGLHPEMNLYEVGRPYVRDLMGRRFAPDKIQGELLRAGLGLAGFLQDIPGQLDQVLTDLESGKLTLRIEHPELGQLGKHFNSLATRVGLSAVVCGGLVAAAILLAPWQAATLQVPWLGVGALALAGAAAWTGIVWHWASGAGGKKVRLRDWMAFWRRMKRPE